MTAIVEVNLVCNGPSVVSACPTREFLTFPTQSIKSARMMAGDKGWRVYRWSNGTSTKTKDVCPACSENVRGERAKDVYDRHQPALTAAQLIGNTLQRRKP
jgi:hypothetical protein